MDDHLDRVIDGGCGGSAEVTPDGWQTPHRAVPRGRRNRDAACALGVSEVQARKLNLW
jgi:hypothetical protein